MYKIHKIQLMGAYCKAQELYLMHCGVLNGREIHRAGYICICMADSFCCAVEANTTL